MHLTERCDQDTPHLSTHVETTRASNGDVDVTPLIHQAFKEKELLPKQHSTDINYAEAKQFLESQRDYSVDLALQPHLVDRQFRP